MALCGIRELQFNSCYHHQSPLINQIWSRFLMETLVLWWSLCDLTVISRYLTTPCISLFSNTTWISQHFIQSPNLLSCSCLYFSQPEEGSEISSHLYVYDWYLLFLISRSITEDEHFKFSLRSLTSFCWNTREALAEYKVKLSWLTKKWSPHMTESGRLKG